MNLSRHGFGGHDRAGCAVSLTAAPGSIEVSDEGPGIPEEIRAQIFDRFVRGDGDRARSGSGSGLGLAIVRAVTESLGGSVSLDSGEAGGTRFTVRIPAAEAATRESVPPAPVGERSR